MTTRRQDIGWKKYECANVQQFIVLKNRKEKKDIHR